MGFRMPPHRSLHYAGGAVDLSSPLANARAALQMYSVPGYAGSLPRFVLWGTRGVQVGSAEDQRWQLRLRKRRLSGRPWWAPVPVEHGHVHVALPRRKRASMAEMLDQIEWEW